MIFRFDMSAWISEKCQEIVDFYWECGHHITWGECRSGPGRTRHFICDPRHGCSIQQHPPRFLNGSCTWCREEPQNPALRGIRSHPGCNVLPPGELEAQRVHIAILHDMQIASRRAEERERIRRLRAEVHSQHQRPERYVQEVDRCMQTLERTSYCVPNGCSGLFADRDVSGAQISDEICGVCRLGLENLSLSR
jgi:hypothetical protein